MAGGATILLTTQYLDEADQLADRISLVEGGRVVTEGTPDELKSRLGGDRVEVVLRDAARLPAAAALVGAAAGAEATVEPDTRQVSAPVTDRMTALAEVVRALDAAGIAAEDIALRRPTLDEVFMANTERV